MSAPPSGLGSVPAANGMAPIGLPNVSTKQNTPHISGGEVDSKHSGIVGQGIPVPPPLPPSFSKTVASPMVLVPPRRSKSIGDTKVTENGEAVAGAKPKLNVTSVIAPPNEKEAKKSASTGGLPATGPEAVSENVKPESKVGSVSAVHSKSNMPPPPPRPSIASSASSDEGEGVLHRKRPIDESSSNSESETETSSASVNRVRRKSALHSASDSDSESEDEEDDEEGTSETESGEATDTTSASESEDTGEIPNKSKSSTTLGTHQKSSKAGADHSSKHSNAAYAGTAGAAMVGAAAGAASANKVGKASDGGTGQLHSHQSDYTHSSPKQKSNNMAAASASNIRSAQQPQSLQGGAGSGGGYAGSSGNVGGGGIGGAAPPPAGSAGSARHNRKSWNPFKHSDDPQHLQDRIQYHNRKAAEAQGKRDRASQRRQQNAQAMSDSSVGIGSRIAACFKRFGNWTTEVNQHRIVKSEQKKMRRHQEQRDKLGASHSGAPSSNRAAAQPPVGGGAIRT